MAVYAYVHIPHFCHNYKYFVDDFPTRKQLDGINDMKTWHKGSRGYFIPNHKGYKKMHKLPIMVTQYGMCVYTHDRPT